MILIAGFRPSPTLCVQQSPVSVTWHLDHATASSCSSVPVGPLLFWGVSQSCPLLSAHLGSSTQGSVPRIILLWPALKHAQCTEKTSGARIKTYESLKTAIENILVAGSRNGQSALLDPALEP